MKIACTGSTGRVGRLLVKQGVVPLSCDVTDRMAVESAITSVAPDVVIHLAGISNVDYCEVPEHWEEVRRVNFGGTLNVVRACDDRHIPSVFISSEHVFGGHRGIFGGGPYKETDSASKVGINNYALTKVACEGLRYAFPTMKIVRTSYLFDWVRMMTEEFTPDGKYEFPTFIHRSYIYLPHFVSNLYQYADNVYFMPPILHLAGSKVVSQYQFLKDFVRYFHLPHKIIPRRTEWPTGDNLPVVAARPHRAGLDVSLSVSLGLPAYSYEEGFKQMEKDNVRG